MEKSKYVEELVARRFQEEIEAIQECWYCHTSKLLGGVTSPSPDGKNRLIFCLNHKPAGIILSRFEYDPA
ncbi:MAG: hypothetical protein Q8916_06715 [Bacteroidota bacterium]|nr:hypothetical protein [Bacteroidota bacterium]MDP4230083.1 hypothetical protein [Bacteroidota bacterium]MDP4235732.1 hypothetical protein [Bacteroidota bacterium]